MRELGAKLNEERKKTYTASPNWKNGKFENLEPTVMSMNLAKIPGILYKQLTAKERSPAKPIPLMDFQLDQFLDDSRGPRFIWYGHSALLLRVAGKTIFIDPMMGPDSAPIGPIRIRRFSENTLEVLTQLPAIDLVLLSHDHYDHLDLRSIAMLKEKTSHFFVAIGVERHLVYWGVEEARISSFDWWEQRAFGNLYIHFTPTRHFSGRGLRDRFKSLWGGWVIEQSGEKIYFSGDSGYGSHFREVGQRLGPFAIGFMECGQYNENWHQIHMFPEESVTAAIEAGVKQAVPVHWGAFSLALHTWKDPVQRFVAAAAENGLPCLFPLPGQVFSMDDSLLAEWWSKYS